MTTISFSQSRKKIQRSWIKKTVINLTGKEPKIEADTLYTRYVFDGPNLYISFYPGWDSYKQEWSMGDNQLTVGFANYIIEALTDTSLTIMQPGFRRMEFLSEEYISSQDQNLISLGEFNGKPLYQANKLISPRYLKHLSFYDKMREGLELGNITQPDIFQVTFIVTEEGKVENVQLVKGMAPGHDKEVMERIQKSSKSWKPAFYKGQPIQTRFLFEVKFLPSLIRNQSGRPGL
jgi:TonB-like protein